MGTHRYVSIAATILVVAVTVAADTVDPRREALNVLRRVFADTTVVQLPWRPSSSSEKPTLPTFPPIEVPTFPPIPQLPSWKDANISDECKSDMEYYQKKLERWDDSDIWAQRMFDSSTKFPEGLLHGQMMHMGNFDECLLISNVKSESKTRTFDGQHCMVTITVSEGTKTESKEDESPKTEEDEWVEHVHSMYIEDYKSNTRSIISSVSIPIEVAWCSPSSCTPGDLETLANAALVPLKETLIDSTHQRTILLNAKVDSAKCHTPVPPTLRAVDIFAICLLGIFVAMAGVSTAYDIITREEENRNPLLLAFSVVSNWPRLIAVNTQGDQLHCLHGIRAVSIGWVVLGHVYLVNAALPSLNSFVYMREFIPALSRLVIMNATVSVDSFLFMSGLLLSFLFIKEVRKTNRFNFIHFYIHRYIRLTPPLAILLLLSVTIMNYAGNGPYWHSRHNNIKKNCEDNWWTNIIYVNNYVHPHKMCLGHTWYLAVDMQLYWLSPLVLVPLWKLGKRNSMVIITILLVAGWAIPFAISYIKELLPGNYTGTAAKRNETMRYYYWATHMRYVPWLLGILTGYILQEARKRKPQLPSWAITCGWILSTVFMTGALNGAYPFQQFDYEYNRVEAAFWLSLFRPVWTVGLAWIVFACDQGYGGAVNVILSWGFWQPLARLSYGVYLVHITVLNLFAGVIRSPLYLADVVAIPQFFGVLIMSILWAIPLSLLFESPIILIEKVIFGRGKAKEQHRHPDQHKAELPQGLHQKRWDDTVIEKGSDMTLPRITLTGAPGRVDYHS